MCIYDHSIQNPRYKQNNKNGGIIPPFSDGRVLHVPIKCGNCIECRKQKSREWQIRLLEDIKQNRNGKFITLTFSDVSIKELSTYTEDLQGYDRDNKIAKIGTRRFLERWRKEHGKSLRHWLITELGHRGTENIHLHGIIWTDDVQQLEKFWKYGYVWKGYYKNGKLINYVNESTVGYITKYVNKVDTKYRCYKPTMLTSSGMGRGYTKPEKYYSHSEEWLHRDKNGIWRLKRYNKYKIIDTLSVNAKSNQYRGINTDDTYRTSTGHKLPLPTYYRNKIYTDDEKEKIWIHKLDKEEKWICGDRIDLTKDGWEENFFKLRQFHRRNNAALGYGNAYTNQNRKFAEEQRRNTLHEIRIDRTNTH